MSEGSVAASRNLGRPGRRAFYVAVTVVMMVVVAVGFWPSYFGRIGAGVQRPTVIHVHALIFAGWMVLLLTQASLVFSRRTPVHCAVGPYGAVYGGWCW